jgi:hypothetical protein
MDEELAREDQAIEDAWQSAKGVNVESMRPIDIFVSGWCHGRRYQTWKGKREKMLESEGESAGKGAGS